MRRPQRAQTAGSLLKIIRAPLQQEQMHIAFAHTKAIPFLKHSALAYIPVPRCNMQH
jgi:hypothetical protein